MPLNFFYFYFALLISSSKCHKCIKGGVCVYACVKESKIVRERKKERQRNQDKNVFFLISINTTFILFQLFFAQDREKVYYFFLLLSPKPLEDCLKIATTEQAKYCHSIRNIYIFIIYTPEIICGNHSLHQHIKQRHGGKRALKNL